MWSFTKKNCCWVNFKWVIIQNHTVIFRYSQSSIRLVKLCNQERIRPCYRRWSPDLAVKKDFKALKAEVDKLDINKLVNAATSLNNLKTKVDDLNVGKLKTVPVDFKN